MTQTAFKKRATMFQFWIWVLVYGLKQDCSLFSTYLGMVSFHDPTRKVSCPLWCTSDAANLREPRFIFCILGKANVTCKFFFIYWKYCFSCKYIYIIYIIQIRFFPPVCQVIKKHVLQLGEAHSPRMRSCSAIDIMSVRNVGC